MKNTIFCAAIAGLIYISFHGLCDAIFEPDFNDVEIRVEMEQ